MKVQSFLSVLLFAAASFTAQAQTQTPAKPAAKVAKPAPAPAKAASEADKTLTLGGKAGKGALLTRDELRVCMSQEETLRLRLDAHTALRAPLNKEKADLATAQQGLRTERAPLDDLKKQAEALGERLKAYGARVTELNDGVTAYNEANAKGAKAERDRLALNKEREDLAVQQKALDAERVEFTAKSEAAVRDYNAKVAAVDAQVGGWNKRNEQWNEEARALEVERSEWVLNCADRRYREEDEIAIKRGK